MLFILPFAGEKPGARTVNQYYRSILPKVHMLEFIGHFKVCDIALQNIINTTKIYEKKKTMLQNEIINYQHQTMLIQRLQELTKNSSRDETKVCMFLSI